MSKNERPEALAQFAESARRGERAGVAGLSATKATEPIPTDPEAKQEAATRVLAEGATGEDFDSEEAVAALPDRILQSQEKSNEAAEAGEASSEVPELDQAPGRMVSPPADEAGSEASPTDLNSDALDALVSRGISREAAIEMLAEMGPPSPGERLKEWAERVLGSMPTKESRKEILAEHHEKGIPPADPPPLKE